MPIQHRPLLEYWFGILYRAAIKDVLVNLHYHADLVGEFISQPEFSGWVNTVYESELLGTAGTLRKNINAFKGSTLLLVHADNWCCCDFSEFINFHHNLRPEGTLMTMMTFESLNPSSCGIVEVDNDGVIRGFHEKVINPPGNLANAAVYLIEPEVLAWIVDNPGVSDFSTEVLPHMIGKIATWKNTEVHRDIGTIEVLKMAQKDNCKLPPWTADNEWQDRFLSNPIQQQINI